MKEFIEILLDAVNEGANDVIKAVKIFIIFVLFIFSLVPLVILFLPYKILVNVCEMIRKN